MHPFSTRNQTCPNSNCLDFEKVGRLNVITHHSKARRLKCKSCGRTWVDRKNTPFYRSKKAPHLVNRAMELLGKGFSIREVALLTQISPSTIQSWKSKYLNTLKYEC